MTFDRSTVRRLDAAVQKALGPVAEEFGVALVARGCRFNPAACTVKVEFLARGADGTVATHASAAKAVGLPEDVIGKAFVHLGSTYTVVEVNAGRPKYPVVATSARGARYKFQVDTVLAGLPGAAPAGSRRFKPGDRVLVKSLFRPEAQDLGIVAAALPAGRYTVMTVRGWRTSIEADLSLTGQRSDDAILDDIHTVYNSLSPEYLTADGERPRAQVRQLKADLDRMLRHLFAEIGREVTEEDVLARWEARRAASRA